MFDLVDLHTHSHFSDGVLAPTELLGLAAKRRVKVLALTDHDTTDGCAEAAAAAALHGIGFIPGTELTAGWHNQEIHIVGLGVQVRETGLADYCAAVGRLRSARIRAIGERLSREPALAGRDPAAGILGGKSVPTRTHVARELVRLGLATSVQQAFERFLARRRAGYVPAEWPALPQAIGAIRAAGGLAVLAHPHRYRLSHGGLQQLCGEFREAGGAGLEVSISGASPADLSRLARLARAYGLAGSIASDFHEPGLPWRPLGRFDKLPDEVVPILAQLMPS